MEELRDTCINQLTMWNKEVFIHPQLTKSTQRCCREQSRRTVSPYRTNYITGMVPAPKTLWNRVESNPSDYWWIVTSDTLQVRQHSQAAKTTMLIIWTVCPHHHSSSNTSQISSNRYPTQDNIFRWVRKGVDQFVTIKLKCSLLKCRECTNQQAPIPDSSQEYWLREARWRLDKLRSHHGGAEVLIDWMKSEFIFLTKMFNV